MTIVLASSIGVALPHIASIGAGRIAAGVIRFGRANDPLLTSSDKRAVARLSQVSFAAVR
jgi:hypothetical protein